MTAPLKTNRKSNRADEFHDAITLIAGGGRESIKLGYDQARKILKQGIDPNCLDGGISPLCRLMLDPSEDQKHRTLQGMTSKELNSYQTYRTRSINLMTWDLLEAGADPWVGDPSTWDAKKFNGQAMSYLLYVLSLNEEKSDISCLDKKGRTPLHALICRYDHNFIQGWFRSDGSSIYTIGRKIRNSWQTTRDQDGNLPLHSLWASAESVPERNIEEFLQHALHMQQSIAKAYAAHGGKWAGDTLEEDCTQAMRQVMADTNHHGDCVASLMLKNPLVRAQLANQDEKDQTAWTSLAEEVVLAHATPQVERTKRHARL